MTSLGERGTALRDLRLRGVRRGDRELRDRLAGHLPPLLVRPDGTGEFLDTSPAPPLGVGEIPVESRTFQIDDGSLLVLYTDGLVEDRQRDIDDGLQLLQDVFKGEARPGFAGRSVPGRAGRRVRPSAARRHRDPDRPAQPDPRGSPRHLDPAARAHLGGPGAQPDLRAAGAVEAWASCCPPPSCWSPNWSRTPSGHAPARSRCGCARGVAGVRGASTARPRCPGCATRGGTRSAAAAWRWSASSRTAGERRRTSQGKIVWCEQALPAVKAAEADGPARPAAQIAETAAITAAAEAPAEAAGPGG